MYDSEHDALITAAVLGGVWGTLVPAEARGLGDMDPRRIGVACGLPGASGGGVLYRLPGACGSPQWVVAPPAVYGATGYPSLQGWTSNGNTGMEMIDSCIMLLLGLVVLKMTGQYIQAPIM